MNNEKETMVSEAFNASYSKTTQAGKTKKGRFNIIDFFLLLIILAVVAAVVLYFIPGAFQRLTATDETDIVFTLEFKGVDEAFIANIKNGDAVYDANRNYMLGSVKSVEHYAYTILVYNEAEGTSEMKEVQGLANLIVTVKAKAIYTDGEGYSVNGERIAVGHAYDISFPNFNGSAYCVELSATSN